MCFSINLQIVKIENLGHLTELRVLNLAGNEIVNVCNVSGMRALAELNLRRNKITTVVSTVYFIITFFNNFIISIIYTTQVNSAFYIF